SGGIQNIGCTARDLLNHGRDVREELKGHDAETLNEFFLSEQEKNPSFRFEIDRDNDNRLKRCFWADAISRRSYANFGDVVVFDTTYNTNKYSMIFAPFIGVNHHGQSIVFGSAFLSDETFESFVWLFTKWLSAMPTGAPKLLIIDQDPAIAKAIRHSLPHTFHRLCI
ncbi:hypothetical protein, partial [Geminicoccus harenae]|uniref:hypothetical protein n=1 Tax=Geminicoccus harenae TaxID=2498453 RepID=UPI001C98585F